MFLVAIRDGFSISYPLYLIFFPMKYISTSISIPRLGWIVDLTTQGLLLNDDFAKVILLRLQPIS